MTEPPNIQQVKKEALEVLQSTLERTGEFLDHQWVGRNTGTEADPGYNISWRFRVTKGLGRGKEWWIRAEVKAILHPKQAVAAIWALKRGAAKAVDNTPIYPVLIAPFISQSVAGICREEGVGFIDLSGNCDLEFGGLWIERRGLPRKYKEQRSAKSLFTPKASRVLKVILQGPFKSYLVNILASEAKVSLGQVSKVRKLLLEQDLAKETKSGICIKNPDRLLAEWVQEDSLRERIEIQEYSTLLTGLELAEHLTVYCGDRRKQYTNGPLFTLNFAASLRAPHNVANTVSAYLPDFPDDDLLVKLNARRLHNGGGNLKIFVPKDFHSIELGSQNVKGLQLVSDLQLYLDLQDGEPNGKEQAEVLLQMKNFNGGWHE